MILHIKQIVMGVRKIGRRRIPLTNLAVLNLVARIRDTARAINVSVATVPNTKIAVS